ncbi:hypothetical protein UlMin_019242 [Ulmus minor]
MGAEDIESRLSLVEDDVANEVEVGVVFEEKMQVDDDQFKQLLASDKDRVRPLLYLLEDTKEYQNRGVGLYKAVLKNDWVAAERIISKDRRILQAAITKGEETVLHLAARAKHVQFVKELVKLMNEEDLALQDGKGNTAFCFAATAGSVEIAEIMMQKNMNLPLIPGGKGMTPLYMAACFGHAQMAWFLYPIIRRVVHEEEWIGIFFTCINNDLCGLALKMFEDDRTLAKARDVNNDTALHVLARRPWAFFQQSSPRIWKRYTSTSLMSSGNPNLMESLALQLVKGLWEAILVESTDLEIEQIIHSPSNLLFEAAELGNFQFLVELIRSYPDLIWETDEKNQTIFHIAVLNRHASIFNLIHDIGLTKDVILTFEDDENNNILHLAATLPPSHKLNCEQGGIFQLQEEISWFKAVKKIIQPLYAKKRNSNGLTPQDVFRMTHANLLRDGEQWMRSTSKSCMLVSTLIAVGAYFANFDGIGGFYGTKGSALVYFESNWIIALTISKAITFFSSFTSMIMFLSILISRYADMEFLGLLPLRLVVGLITLFISVATMMVAFGARIFVPIGLLQRQMLSL